MKKRLLSLFLSFVLVLTAALSAPFSAAAASSTEQAVLLSSVATSDWMSAIRGETKLTEITIPGTHDSCARKFANEDAFGITSGIAKCQSLNITEQLNAGIRYLDIRCEVDSSTYSIKTVHGSVDCWNGNDYYYLDYVFQDIYNWLAEHPSETVLVSIKEDDGDAGAAVFTSAVYEYIHGYGQSKYFYGSDYVYTDYWYLGKSVPTLDAVRGKCVLMNRFDQIIATSGSTASEEESGQKVKWGDYSGTNYSTPVYDNVTNTNTGVGTFHVQDHYKWNTQSKINATQEMLSLGHWRGEYYFNFSSTVSDSTIPNPSNLASTVNAAYPNFTYNLTKPSGIFAMDFATSDLARYIIKNNEAVSNLVTGTDGNITYEINRLTGTLTISGSGAMNDYALDSNSGIKDKGTTAPWGDQIKNCLFDGQYNTDIITSIVVNDGVTSIGDYAFYGFDNVTSIQLPDSVTSIGTGAIPENASTDYYSVNVKAGNISKESANPFAGKTLSGVTIKYTQKCDTDRGWNNSIINFSTGNNADNRYFILMTNGTILFNDGNGGAGGWNNCYFDLNTSSEVNTTGQGWVDITVTIYKNSSGQHILDYYINNTLAKTYNLSENCASGYPNGVSGSDGIFSFLSSPDIKLYYGATFNIYNMGGTTDCYLDSAEFYDYALSAAQLVPVYENTFTDSLGGTAVTGRSDGGYSVYHQTTDNDGRSGTAYLPYSNTGASGTNYVITNESPFANLYTSNGFAVSFWQRINGNYWGDRESITFAQGEIGEMKYFTLGSDGYIRFNNGNGGSDSSLSSAGLYFDYTTANSAITKQQWHFITYNIIDDHNFKVYVDGVLTATVYAAGTSQYQSSGGLMSFLASPSTKLYLGSYTPYWGTPTLSLDDVMCFCETLTDSEVAALYKTETNNAGAAFTTDFVTAPEKVSGSMLHYDSFDGKTGVLYLPTCSAEGEIAVYVDGVQTTNLSAIPENTVVEVRYTGSGTVKQWTVTNSGGTLTSTDSTYSFTLTSDTKVDVELVYVAQVDTSALEAAIALLNNYQQADYTTDSYNALVNAVSAGSEALSSSSQTDIDSATANILEAIYNLVPFLTLTVSSETGGTTSVMHTGLVTAQSSGTFHPYFGDSVYLTASADSGYVFAGWYEKRTHRILSTNSAYTLIISSNTDLKPLFKLSGASTLTFANDNGYIARIVNKLPSSWAATDSIASLCPSVPYHYGGTNGHWDYDNAAVLAALAAGNDVTVYPAYTESTVTEPDIPVATDGIPALTLTLDIDWDEYVASYIMALGVPEGCEVVEKGIAFKFSSSDSFHPSDFDLTLDNKTTTSKFNTEEDSGVFIVNVRNFSSYSWAAKAYCTYYDENHVLRVAYSEQVNYG